MVHLRVVVPPGRAEAALDCLRCSRAVINLVHLPGVARTPDGDLIECDVAREDASVVLAELRALGIGRDGSITVHYLDAVISEAADAAVEAAEGFAADAVVWEDVTARTSESAELSGAYVVFFVLAGLIASVGIYLDSPILVVGAMVVGPEFGPVAGLCVAIVQRRRRPAWLSFRALLVGFPASITAVILASLLFRATGVTPDGFSGQDSALAQTIAHPDFLAFFVAFCAGVAGMVSMTTAKSGALIGVLISVTTIPAAAEAGIAAAYGDGSDLAGAFAQLALNLVGLVLAGVLTLAVQREFFRRRAAAYRQHAGRGGDQRSPR